jgi:hypothetical protein
MPFIKNQSIFVLSIFTALSLVGCATANKEQASCEATDWYETGRRDGAQGMTSDKLTEHKEKCGKSFQSDWETVYTNGRNAGLIEYCEPKNGYEMGRMGISYFYVCPSTMEPEFLSFYRKGQRAHNLEQESSDLNLKIDELTKRLTATNDGYDQRQIASELSELKQSRAQKEKELANISSN